MAVVLPAGKLHYHSIDGDQVIAEYDASGNLTAKYIYGPGIDEPVKGLSPAGSVPEWYYHYDGLGSVTNLTDSAGATLETYTYDAFGKPTTTSAIGNRYMFTGREYDSETGLYYYRARYYSPELGRFLQRDPYTWGPNDPRATISLPDLTPALLSVPNLFSVNDLIGINSYINGELGRQISSIGARNPLLLHPYLYCRNNPTNFTDPYGQVPVAVVIVGKFVGKAVITGVIAGSASAIVSATAGYARGLRRFELAKYVAKGFAKGFVSGTVAGALIQLGTPRPLARTIGGSVAGFFFGDPFSGAVSGLVAGTIGPADPFGGSLVGSTFGEIMKPIEGEGGEKKK